MIFFLFLYLANRTIKFKLPRIKKQRNKYYFGLSLENLEKKRKQVTKRRESRDMSYHHAKLVIRITVLGAKGTGKSSKYNLHFNE